MVALTSISGLTTSADKAVGYIEYAELPAADETLVVNGVTFTFKASSGGATEITIGADTDACATNTATILNGSANGSVSVATYAASGSRVGITFDTAGSTGEAFTLGAGTSGATLSGATLLMPGAAVALNAIPANLRSSDYEKAVMAMVSLVQSIIEQTGDPSTSKITTRRQRHLLKQTLRHLADTIPTAASESDNRATDADKVAAKLLNRFAKAKRDAGL